MMRRQQGQSLVFFALMLGVILGALALIIDVGFAYADRRYQQDAADAAALEGARLLAVGATTDAHIRSEINRLVGLNCSAVDVAASVFSMAVHTCSGASDSSIKPLIFFSGFSDGSAFSTCAAA